MMDGDGSGDGSRVRDDRAIIVRTTVCHVLSAIDRQGHAWSGLHDDGIEEVMDDDDCDAADNDSDHDDDSDDKAII
jgi:hypothetical protein